MAKYAMLMLVVFSLGFDDIYLRRVKEISLPELTLELVEAIIRRYNLEPEVEEAAEEAVHDYSQVIELHKLTQAVVLMIAKQLPQYQGIEIEDYLGRLNAWEMTVIEDTYEVFEELKGDLVKKIEETLMRQPPNIKFLAQIFVDRPYGVAMDRNGNILVVNESQLLGFNSDGELLFAHSLEKGAFDVALNSEGKIYVLNREKSSIYVYNKDGRLLFQFGDAKFRKGALDNPFAIAIDAQDRIYVADWEHYKVQVFNSRGEFLFNFWIPGREEGMVSPPGGIVVDAGGRIFVSNTLNNRIDVFDSKGQFLFSFGENTRHPRGLAVDSEGRIWVADSENHRIQIFNSAGIFLYEFGERGEEGFQFYNPQDIFVNPVTGEIVVADTSNNRVQIFKLSSK
jgi:DNA-binding beta-propeller fold protein YncE